MRIERRKRPLTLLEHRSRLLGSLTLSGSTGELLPLRLILTLLILACPYLCLGGLCGGATCAGGGDCANHRGRPATNAVACSCCCKAQPKGHAASLASKQPRPNRPARPSTPGQCMCQGALSVADGRAAAVDLAWLILPTAEPTRSAVVLAIQAGTGDVDDSADWRVGGRELLVRDCALRI